MTTSIATRLLIIQTVDTSTMWEGCSSDDWEGDGLVWSHPWVRKQSPVSWRADHGYAIMLATGEEDGLVEAAMFSSMVRDLKGAGVVSADVQTFVAAHNAVPDVAANPAWHFETFHHGTQFLGHLLNDFACAPNGDRFNAVLHAFGPPEELVALALVLQSYLLCHRNEWDGATETRCYECGLVSPHLTDPQVSEVRQSVVDRPDWWIAALGLPGRADLLTEHARRMRGEDLRGLAVEVLAEAASGGRPPLGKVVDLLECVLGGLQ